MNRLALATFVLAANAALACSVCGAGQGDNDQGAYLTMTIIMSLLPLAAIGGIVFWVAKSSRDAS